MTKSFKNTAKTSAAKFISTQDTQATQDTRATEPTFYRINLKLDGDLKEYLADEAWRNRTSITQLVNDMIKEYRKNHEGK